MHLELFCNRGSVMFGKRKDPFLCKFLILSAYFYALLIIVTPLSYTSIKAKIIDHNIVEQLDFKLVQHNGRNKFDGTFKFKVDLTSLEMQGILDFERSPKKWVRFVNLKVDFCKFLGNSYKTNRYLRVLLKNLKQIEGLPHSCPIQAHRVFKIEQFDTIWELPEYMPNVSFSLKVNGFSKGHRIHEIIVDGFSKDYVKEE